MPATPFALAGRLAAGERILAGWSGLAEPAIAEILVRAGFDTVVLDMQHGAFTVESVLRGIAALALAGAPAIVRVPVGENATASRLLDGGAAAIIAPMINTAEDARALAAFTKYRPVGERSWGPQRALALSGLDPAGYLAAANGLHLTLPMVETASALAELDAILAVPGVDGVFVGPADLSIALSNGSLDPRGAAVDNALGRVAARCQTAGKVAGLFCLDGAQARVMGARGFGLCSVMTDAVLLSAAARDAVAAAR